MRFGKSNTGQPRVRIVDENGEDALVDPVSVLRMRLGKSNTGRPRFSMEDEVGEE